MVALWSIPNASNSACQNHNKKCRSQSLISFRGIPCYATTTDKNNCAISLAVIASLQGTKQTNLLNWLTIIKILSWPRAVTGRCVIKSKFTCSNTYCGTDNGYNVSSGTQVLDLDA